MPIIFNENISGARIVVWHITESAEELRGLVTGDDAASCEGMGASRRVVERLAWRAAARSVLSEGVSFTYDPVGAPLVRGADVQIGVSHCAGYAAVILSEKRCAIDIELFTRDFSRVAPRFITPEEKALDPGDPRFDALVWCAKEALYKFARRKELDLLGDIYILGIDFGQDGNMQIIGRIREGGPMRLKVLPVGGICLVYLAQE